MTSTAKLLQRQLSDAADGLRSAAAMVGSLRQDLTAGERPPTTYHVRMLDAIRGSMAPAALLIFKARGTGTRADDLMLDKLQQQLVDVEQEFQTALIELAKSLNIPCQSQPVGHTGMLKLLEEMRLATLPFDDHRAD